MQVHKARPGNKQSSSSLLHGSVWIPIGSTKLSPHKQPVWDLSKLILIREKHDDTSVGTSMLQCRFPIRMGSLRTQQYRDTHSRPSIHLQTWITGIPQAIQAIECKEVSEVLDIAEYQALIC